MFMCRVSCACLAGQNAFYPQSYTKPVRKILGVLVIIFGSTFKSGFSLRKIRVFLRPYDVACSRIDLVPGLRVRMTMLISGMR